MQVHDLNRCGITGIDFGERFGAGGFDAADYRADRVVKVGG